MTIVVSYRIVSLPPESLVLPLFTETVFHVYIFICYRAMVILGAWKFMLAFTCFTESLLIEFMIIRENETLLAVPNSSSSITTLLPAPSTTLILFQTIFRKFYFLNKQRINLFNFISLNWECLAQLYGIPPPNMLFAVVKHFERSVKDYQIIVFVSSLWLLLKGLPPAGALCDSQQRS